MVNVHGKGMTPNLPDFNGHQTLVPWNLDCLGFLHLHFVLLQQVMYRLFQEVHEHPFLVHRQMLSSLKRASSILIENTRFSPIMPANVQDGPEDEGFIKLFRWSTRSINRISKITKETRGALSWIRFSPLLWNDVRMTSFHASMLKIPQFYPNEKGELDHYF